jgi:hypothetical protein
LVGGVGEASAGGVPPASRAAPPFGGSFAIHHPRIAPPLARLFRATINR